jgi:hypothetical protein
LARNPVGFGRQGDDERVLKKGWTMRLTADRWEDARAAELHNLRVALATFALQLDAFEMRASGALLAAGREASIAATPISRSQDFTGGK